MADLKLLGVKVGARSLLDIAAACETAMKERRRPFLFACANPHSLVVAQTDLQFRYALDRADAIVADGIGCLLGGIMSGTSVGPRITGSDFFLAIMHGLDRRSGKAFFFGSRDEVLEKLAIQVRRNFPNVRIEMHSPPFRQWSESENDDMVAKIKAFDPDVLWVGMTAPKQEKWAAANAESLQVPVVGSIGAVFDYYAGVTKRAPPWICDLGLEWLYRLPREPQRLWRRTFVSAPIFLWLSLRERFGARG